MSVGHGSCCRGAVDLHLGRLAFGLGDLDAADAQLDTAAGLHRRAGTRLWLAHTQRDRAAVLWKSGGEAEPYGAPKAEQSLPTATDFPFRMRSIT